MTPFVKMFCRKPAGALTVCIIAFFSFVGESCKPGAVDVVAEYRHALAKTDAARGKAKDAYVVLQNYLNKGPATTDSPPVAEVQQQLVGAQEAYVKSLEGISPKDPALHEAHELLLSAERHRLNGFYELAGSLKESETPASFRGKTAPAELANAEADRRCVRAAEALERLAETKAATTR